MLMFDEEVKHPILKKMLFSYQYDDNYFDAGEDDWDGENWFKFYRKIDDQVMLEFTLSNVPSMCGMFMIHDFYIPRNRPQIKNILTRVVNYFFKEVKYTVCMVTTTDKQPVVESIIKDMGFKPLGSFVNKRTENFCTIWTLEK